MAKQNFPASKRTMPSIPCTSPDFVYRRGADVQATWRKFGWTPIAEEQPAPIAPRDEKTEVVYFKGRK